MKKLTPGEDEEETAVVEFHPGIFGESMSELMETSLLMVDSLYLQDICVQRSVLCVDL